MEDLPLQAAAIFRERAIADLVSESGALREANRSRQPFLDLLQTIDISVGGSSDKISVRLEEGRRTGPRRREGPASWTVPIHGAPPRLLDDMPMNMMFAMMGRGNSMEASCSGISLISFPTSVLMYNRVQNPVVTKDAGDGSLRLRLALLLGEGIWLEGRLDHLSDTALGYFEEGMFVNQLMAPMGALQAGPDASFTPTTVRMEMTEDLRETLDIVLARAPDAASAAEGESDGELLRSIGTAFSIERYVEEHREQKLRRGNLLAARDRLRTLEIRHGTEGRARILLDRSRAVAPSGVEEASFDAEEFWEVQLLLEDQKVIFNDLAGLRITLAGIPVHCPQGPLFGGAVPILSYSDNVLYFTLQYSKGFILRGALDLGGLEEGAHRDILENFQEKSMSSLGGAPAVFPSGLKLKLIVLLIRKSKVQHIFERLDGEEV